MSLKKGEVISPERAKDFALLEAKKGLGFVSPNPPVGCVVVDKEHRFLASGYHHYFGGDHAEVDALKKLGSQDLDQATVYVTLEPCAHEGKTPSCAKRLAKEPIKKLICALEDPNPLVAGKGFQILKQAGIEVEKDVSFALQSQEVAEAFLWNMTHRKPFVTLKVACSADGYMVNKEGVSKWITSEESRRLARELRGQHDATLIGAGTLIKDDPYLNFRETVYEKKRNKIVIWDPKNQAAEFLPKSQLLKEHGEDHICVLSPRQEQNFNTFSCSEIGDEALDWLYQQKIYSLFVEGGAYTFQQFLKARRFQRLYKFQSSKEFRGGKLWDGGLNLPLEEQWTREIGGDTLTSYVGT